MEKPARIVRKMFQPVRATTWQFVMLFLSIYVLLALLAELLTGHQDTKLLLRSIDNWVCVVFLGDFFVRWYRAPAKIEFLKWNWIDLLSSIPAWDALRVGRLVRVLRILRALRSAKYIATYVLKRRWGGVVSAAALSFLFVTFAAIAILNVENTDGSNIRNASDALWWAMTTITTVGYGDRYPVTQEGRAVAAVLMVAGAGIFGILSGALASIFLQSDAQETQNDLAGLKREVVRLREQIQSMEKKMEPESGLASLTQEIRDLRLALHKEQDGRTGETEERTPVLND